MHQISRDIKRTEGIMSTLGESIRIKNKGTKPAPSVDKTVNSF